MILYAPLGDGMLTHSDQGTEDVIITLRHSVYPIDATSSTQIEQKCL